MPLIGYLIVLVALALAWLGAKDLLKTWFYRRLGPKQFKERESPGAKRDRGALIGTALLTGLVVFCLAYGARSWLLLRSVQSVPGVVDEAIVRAIGRRHGVTRYGLAVKFSFDVDGRRYQGDRFSNDNRYGPSDVGASDAIGITAGKGVPVYFPRGRPENAFLVKDTKPAYLLPVFGLVGLIILVPTGRNARRVARGMFDDWRANSAGRSSGFGA